MIEEIVAQIYEDNLEDNVAEALDEEITNWVDQGWENDYESEYEWYSDCGTGEAEDVIIRNMIASWAYGPFGKGKELSTENYLKVYEGIKDKYEILSRA